MIRTRINAAVKRSFTALQAASTDWLADVCLSVKYRWIHHPALTAVGVISQSADRHKYTHTWTHTLAVLPLTEHLWSELSTMSVKCIPVSLCLRDQTQNFDIQRQKNTCCLEGWRGEAVFWFTFIGVHILAVFVPNYCYYPYWLILSINSDKGTVRRSLHLSLVANYL